MRACYRLEVDIDSTVVDNEHSENYWGNLMKDHLILMLGNMSNKSIFSNLELVPTNYLTSEEERTLCEILKDLETQQLITYLFKTWSEEEKRGVLEAFRGAPDESTPAPSIN